MNSLVLLLFTDMGPADGEAATTRGDEYEVMSSEVKGQYKSCIVNLTCRF